jgi:hypothetical protein
MRITPFSRKLIFHCLIKRRKASYIEDDVGLTVIDVQVAVTYWVFFRKLL